MRIALAQLDLVIGDLAHAERALRQAAAHAYAAGAGLLLASELAACGGYPPRDLLERPAFVAAQWAMLERLAVDLPLSALIGCAEALSDGPMPRLANALALIDGGRVRSVCRKRLLPTYDVFDEARYFRPGDRPAVVEVGGLRLGLTICEDLWAMAPGTPRYGRDPVAELGGRCDLILNASASPYHCGKPRERARVVADAARRAGVPVLYANQVGAHDELLFDGGSCAIAPDGGPEPEAGGQRRPSAVAGDARADPAAAPVAGRAGPRRLRQPAALLELPAQSASRLVVAAARRRPAPLTWRSTTCSACT